MSELSGPVLLPNFGAEENLDWRRLLAQPIYHRLAGLWSLLFPGTVTSKGISNSDLKQFLGRDYIEPAFEQLPTGPVGVPWLATSAAWESLHRYGVTPWGPRPQIVRQVHDKAFARQAVLRLGLDPIGIAGHSRIFDPGELESVEQFMRSLRQTIESWPPWAQRRWTLKPRFGSSGRGRVPGAGFIVDTAEIRGSLKRLAQRGGAIAEPVLDRVEDLSAQFFVRSPNHIDFLGSLRQSASVSGSYAGHQAVFWKGELSSGSWFELPLRESSSRLVSLAADAGFVGPCNIDAFSYHLDGEIHLRTCVELNARFSVGMIVAGLVRRAWKSPHRPSWLEKDPSSVHFLLNPPASRHEISPAPPDQYWECRLGEVGGAMLLFAKIEPKPEPSAHPNQSS